MPCEWERVAGIAYWEPRGMLSLRDFVEGEGTDYVDRKDSHRGFPGNDAETQIDAGESYRTTIA